MALDAAQIASLVVSPSLGGVTYQAASLLRQLARINDQEYLPDACKIKDVFECIAEHVLDELWAMHNPDQLFGALHDPDFSRTRALARILHELHSFLRYLWASSPRQSPPGIQSALKLLTKLHFPSANGDPVCLVRPQWKYNLTYVPMTGLLRKNILLPSVLDPNGTLGPSDPDAILAELWTRHRSNITDEEQRTKFGPVPPQQVAILSFAGLDTHDTLSYPLLAHELGHFIDLSYPTPLNVSPPVSNAARIREDEVRQILEKHLGTTTSVPARDVTAWHKALVEKVFVALREIVADLLATRMMGFGYFAAHSEFLKTLAPWPQPTLTNSGYPGIKYRLRLVLEHLLDAAGCDVRSFLEQYSTASELTVREIAVGVDQYLSSWEERVAPVAGASAPSGTSLGDELNQLAVRAVEKAHVELVKLARQAVPQAHCCRMSANFFQRIRLLQQHLPPSCPGEDAGSFAEITAATWAYQILFGEEKEHAKGTLDEQNDEYIRICQLALKAIELIPNGGGDEPASQSKPRSDNTLLSKSGTLSGPDIIARLQLRPGHQQRLSVIPFRRNAVKAASLDVRLGNWFVIARRTRLGAVKMDEAGQHLLMSVGREEVFVSKGQTFLIHPGDLLLGATLEFVALPPDTMAFVEGKSGLGRLGLLVATATTIAPGFHGVVVLELANTGTVPLELEPEMDIAQLVLQVMTNPVPENLLYRGKYYCQIKP